MAKMPELSNCVRVKIDFVIEFEKNAMLPFALTNRAAQFVRAGIQAVIPPEEIKARFGDAHIVLGVDTSMMRMLPREVERRRAEYLRDVSMMDGPPELRARLREEAAKVGNRDGKKEKDGTVNAKPQRRGGEHPSGRRPGRSPKKRAR